tara:strand:- start:243 stop:536 length:294 start_codon:yes stop_codon:yes gene_type:complete
MSNKKIKDLKDEELSKKISETKKELNELMDEFHSRSSVRLEMAEMEFQEAKERLREAIQETNPLEKFGKSKGNYEVRKDGLFMSNHRPFFWSYRKYN